MPFSPHDRQDLLEHFEKHGHEFGVGSPTEYEALADAFWNRPAAPTLHECIRIDGSRCRYDRVTEEYSVMEAWGVVATYFKPVPCATFLDDDEGCPDDCHGFATNLLYFKATCERKR